MAVTIVESAGTVGAVSSAAKHAIRAQYTRLVTCDDGTSTFQDGHAELVPGFSVPPVEPLHMAPFLSGDGTTFWLGARPNWNGGTAHAAPRRMIFVTVRGEYQVETSDGSVRSFPTGSVLIVEDTNGLGHSSWIIGEQDMVVLATGLPATM